jgi:hypothetical protein
MVVFSTGDCNLGTSKIDSEMNLNRSCMERIEFDFMKFQIVASNSLCANLQEFLPVEM